MPIPSAADRNRAADPEFAAWLDGMRSRFGATLTRVEWPDGRTWGTVREARITMTADEWIDYVNDPNPRRHSCQAQKQSAPVAHFGATREREPVL
jgi:hypothetical protein